MRKWRFECTDKCLAAQNAALEASIFILIEYGPTCFGIREDGNRQNMQVRIGDVHSCTCTDFRKTSSELCKHICWALLKKFRIPKEDPLSWQLGLVENEIDGLLRGYEQRNQRRQLPSAPLRRNVVNESTEPEGSIVQRQLEAEDVCPVCQEDFFSKQRRPVTYCKFGCGNSVHMMCMKMWAEHQQPGSNNKKDAVISCPICRGNFCSQAALRLELSHAREYAAPRTTSQSAINVPDPRHTALTSIAKSLPPLMSVQAFSVHLKKENDNQLLENNRILDASITNVHLEDAAKQTQVKDVKISLKKSRPGLQCLQCLSWFKKGLLVYQLPCSHLIHKECAVKAKTLCPVCHQCFSIPVPRSVSSTKKKEPVKSSNEINNSSLNLNDKHVKSLKPLNGSSKKVVLPKDDKQLTTDLRIGQQSQRFSRINSNASCFSKNSLRIRSGSVSNVRSAVIGGERTASYEFIPNFCLTATQVRPAP